MSIRSTSKNFIVLALALGASATPATALAGEPPPAAERAPAEPQKLADEAKATPADTTRARVEAGGALALGTDATQAATRFGGGFVGASWAFGARRDWPLAFRFTTLRGSAVERLPTPSGASPTVDVREAQTRHFADLSIGYRARLAGDERRLWLLPTVGSRVISLVDDAAPVGAVAAAGGLALGFSVGSTYEVEGFAGYARALAKTGAARSIYGAIVGETRFGARALVRPDGKFGLGLAYEGEVLVLEHRQFTTHALLAGLELRFE